MSRGTLSWADRMMAQRSLDAWVCSLGVGGQQGDRHDESTVSEERWNLARPELAEGTECQRLWSGCRTHCEVCGEPSQSPVSWADWEALD